MSPHAISHPQVRTRDRRCLQSDKMACQPARDVLQVSGYPALAAVECSVEAGIVELRGTVGSYSLKKVAQELVQRVKAVRQVRNSIEVIVGC